MDRVLSFLPLRCSDTSIVISGLESSLETKLSKVQLLLRISRDKSEEENKTEAGQQELNINPTFQATIEEI